jgi:hypothetical protein
MLNSRSVRQPDFRRGENERKRELYAAHAGDRLMKKQKEGQAVQDLKNQNAALKKQVAPKVWVCCDR